MAESKNINDVMLASSGALNESDFVDFVYWQAKASTVLYGIKHHRDADAIASAAKMILEASEFISWLDFENAWLVHGTDYGDVNFHQLVWDVQKQLVDALAEAATAPQEKEETKNEKS